MIPQTSNPVIPEIVGEGRRAEGKPRSSIRGARPSSPQVVRGVRGHDEHVAAHRRQLHAQGEWLDHLTEQVFPAGTPVRDIAWAFSPRYWHWLQAGWVTPPAK